MEYKTGVNIKTFEAKCILGMKVGYSEELLTEKELRSAIKQSTSEVKDYVFSGTITKTHIIAYGKGKDYEEPAYLVESSVYPRYLVEVQVFKEKFIEFIGKVAVSLKQERIAVVFSDESLMIETKYCQKPDIK